MADNGTDGFAKPDPTEAAQQESQHHHHHGHSATQDLANERKSCRGSQRMDHRKSGPAAADQKGCTFVDAAAMKEKVREKLSQPKYNVFDFYHETGLAQQIAKHGAFDKITLLVIAFNALWISIDTDMNDSPILSDAHPVFIIAENFFCLYFSFEWVVRFAAFKRKLDGRKDGWFCFDSIMVFMMVLETWIFTILILLIMPDGAAGGGNAGIMRLARLMRLSRMARMGKLLRVMPELMIMIKGMKAACRSVFFTLLLLCIIMYVFGIAFVQLSSETDPGSKFFNGVPQAMYHLLIYGVLLDNVGHITKNLQPEPVLMVLFLLFILIGALTVMNMLVGVLCEVVSAVASTEQEEMLVNYVNGKLTAVMNMLDSDGGGSISKVEFMEIIDNADAVKCLNDVGVDVMALIDLADYIFEDDDAANDDEIELDFQHFMDVVLQLRGTNQATVRDIVDLRKFVRRTFQDNYKQTCLILEKLELGAKNSAQEIHHLSHLFESRSNGDLDTITSVKSSQGNPKVANHTSEHPLQDYPNSFACTRTPDGLVHQTSENKLPSGLEDLPKTHANSNPHANHDFTYNLMLDVAPDFLPTLPPATPTSQLFGIASDNVTSSPLGSWREEFPANNHTWTAVDQGNPSQSTTASRVQEPMRVDDIATSLKSSVPSHIPPSLGSLPLGSPNSRSLQDGHSGVGVNAHVRTDSL